MQFKKYEIGYSSASQVAAELLGESAKSVSSGVFESERRVSAGDVVTTPRDSAGDRITTRWTGVSINAMILEYVKTAAGAESFTRTAVISEDLEEKRSRDKKFTIPMSDDPGQYSEDELRQLFLSYLSQDLTTEQRIRDVLNSCVPEP